ncbi:MAG: DnaJ domain-containing protein [Candidatus Sumerlaeia bacterium]|nr:DnaJ domain-containing protein [Candidatus Sumerlaeia bacterium]
MAVHYRDYYQMLGVPRDADAATIRKAYRTLARKFHPDVNKSDPKAEDKLKEINEAYEVLKDGKKRAAYDQLGPNWKAGQDFNPPPGWAGGGMPGGGRVNVGGMGGANFSEFFESLFGGRAGFRGGPSPFNGGFHEEEEAPSHVETDLEVPAEVILEGGTMSIGLQGSGGTRTFEVRIPKRIGLGKVIRLAGQAPGGGDVHLRVKAVSGRYRVEGLDVVADLPVGAADAALGASLPVTTPDGESVTLGIPPGSSSGRRIRVRGKGLSDRAGATGDFYYQVMVQVPKTLTAAERELFERLRVLQGGGS